jgi:C_GCAxxG_C_C family probable redox protein
MSKSEHAAEQFRAGANCSQAVFGEYAEECGVDPASALKIACGFGGGMGRLGGTCGAVTGAIMVIGLLSSDQGPPLSPAAKARVYALVRSFVEEFETRHGATLCRELLGCDISTPEGHEEANKLGLFETECPKYVEDAVEILEETTTRHG